MTDRGHDTALPPVRTGTDDVCLNASEYKLVPNIV